MPAFALLERISCAVCTEAGSHDKQGNGNKELRVQSPPKKCPDYPNPDWNKDKHIHLIPISSCPM